MKYWKTCLVGFLEGFAFCAVLPLLIFAAVNGGAVNAIVVAWLKHSR